jgi:hypothetical protein
MAGCAMGHLPVRWPVMNVAEAKGTLKRRQAYDLDVVDRQVNHDKVPGFMRSLGVPSRFSQDPLPSIAQCPDRIVDWTRNIGPDRPGLFLLGGRQVGKTYAAAAIVRHCLVIGRTVGWINWADYVPMYTSRLNKATDEETLAEHVEQQFHWRKVYNVVVIDGIDLSINALFVISELTSLIHERTDEGLYTVLTARTPPYRPADAPYEVQAFMDMATSLFQRYPEKDDDGRE